METPWPPQCGLLRYDSRAMRRGRPPSAARGDASTRSAFPERPSVPRKIQPSRAGYQRVTRWSGISPVVVLTQCGGRKSLPGMTEILSTGAGIDGFTGTLTRPGEAGYDEARAVFNGMIDRRPSLIARCS